MLANSTSGELWKIAWVPLPWCTSQSSTSTRSAPSESSAWRAATATFENRQKPIARSASAWWPGGRRPQKPVGASPASSASASAQAAPAERSAASQEPGAGGGVEVEGRAALAVLAHGVDVALVGARASSCSSVASGASRTS